MGMVCSKREAQLKVGTSTQLPGARIPRAELAKRTVGRSVFDQVLSVTFNLLLLFARRQRTVPRVSSVVSVMQNTRAGFLKDFILLTRLAFGAT